MNIQKIFWKYLHAEAGVGNTFFITVIIDKVKQNKFTASVSRTEKSAGQLLIDYLNSVKG